MQWFQQARSCILKGQAKDLFRVQRKSFLQLAIRASWSRHLLAQMSFQLAPKTFWRTELISQFFCYSNSSKNITCPSGKLKTEFTSPIAKSTSPGLSDTTFFARCSSISKCFLEWLLVTLTAFSGFAIRTCGGAEMMWHAWIPTLRWTFWTHHLHVLVEAHCWRLHLGRWVFHVLKFLNCSFKN